MNPGDKLGAYEILEPLGAGGMGEVYRARDPRLDRDVAIKVLPEDFAADPERLARFEREAKLLAQLNHANVAAIYGLEQAGGIRFIAMECVEGETLAQRLARAGRIEVDEALDIALQVAGALEAAHEAGIVHRDLKPANVKVTPEGKVRVLDFGLAKAWEGGGEASGAIDLSHSPTMMDGTRTGVILGTAAYMSPEQARGKPVDKRTDIWAFGCVLFEMLTGERAFHGETVSDTMAAILKEEPALQALPTELSRSGRLLLRRCLEKDPLVRLRDIGEARVLLAAPSEGSFLAGDAAISSAAPAGARPMSAWFKVAVGVGLAATVVLAFWAGSTLQSGNRDAPAALRRLVLAIPEGVGFKYWYRPLVAISGDGTRIAYVAAIEGQRQLYVQDLESGDPPYAIPGSVDAEAPFFSPDGESIGFFQAGHLWTTNASGGQQPVDRASVLLSPGGFWAEDGSILFFSAFGTALQRISPDGEIEDVIEPAPGEEFYYPQLLPGGDNLLLTLWDNRASSVVVVSLPTGRRTTVAEGAVYGRYAATGHILYARGSDLVAVSFDPGATSVGDPVIVARNLVADIGELFAEFAVADDGTVVFLEAEPGGRFLHRLRPGEEPEVVNSNPMLPPIDYQPIDVSHQGDKVAVTLDDADVWVYDLVRNQMDRRVTTFPGFDWQAVFSLDGQRIAFATTRSGWMEFWETSATGGEEPRLLLGGEENKWPGSWSAGGALAYQRAGTDGGTDVFVYDPSDGEGKPFLDTRFNEGSPSLSPDGRLVAYTSNDTGRSEVFVTRFPEGERTRRISNGEGDFPRFSGDGSAIFYSSDSVVMKVEVTDPIDLEFSAPEVFVRGVDTGTWDVMPDGSAVIAIEERPQPKLRLIQGAAALFGGR